MKRIILSVTNDLITDQRVHRIAVTLTREGNDVCVVGRRLPKSLEISERPYKTKRFSLFFHKGFAFYAMFNIRLFFYLLFKKTDILVANDLDTLPAIFCIAKLKRKKILYDSHEYFTDMPELQGRKIIIKIWTLIERIILPRLTHCYTVSEPIAGLYYNKYGIHMDVIRNLPVKKNREQGKNKIRFHFDNKKVILYQGALNIGRGLERVINAMPFIDHAVFVIIGDGDITEKLKKLVNEKDVENKVEFIGKIPMEELHYYTWQADIGIMLEEKMGMSYYYSLSNKLFDYIHAEVPILASDLPEVTKIMKKYPVGLTVTHCTPEHLAEKIQYMLYAQERSIWKENLKQAKQEYCWENEEKKLIRLYLEG